MRFLVDAQLPRRLAVWLQERGHEAIHTLDLAQQNRTADSSLLAFWRTGTASCSAPKTRTSKSATNLGRGRLNSFSSRRATSVTTNCSRFSPGTTNCSSVFWAITRSSS
ncbi:MAG: DUF5615 family PIN-like protein [Verrucomicrobiae bacterium]|nr:DUF5615 family PIN-like protein [Verrucomicrobiae bacterium]